MIVVVDRGKKELAVLLYHSKIQILFCQDSSRCRKLYLIQEELEQKRCLLSSIAVSTKHRNDFLIQLYQQVTHQKPKRTRRGRAMRWFVYPGPVEIAVVVAAVVSPTQVKLWIFAVFVDERMPSC